MRLYDPRSNEPLVGEAEGPHGLKATRCVWVGDNFVLTTGEQASGKGCVDEQPAFIRF